jgi:hypothetical protein
MALSSPNRAGSVDFSARPRHKAWMRRLLLLATLLLSACGEPVPSGNGSAVARDDGPDTVTPSARPVRVGELGPNFAACSAAGTTRHLEPGEPLPVRSAPFDTAAQTGAVAAGARFFVCSRSLDQKWFGIVYAPSGQLEARCGVEDPLTAGRNYAGPCASGWVSTPFVRLIDGEAPQLPQALPEPAAANKSS